MDAGASGGLKARSWGPMRPLSSPPMEENPAAEDAITIVIADDHKVVRAGLRLLLDSEDGFAVVAEAGDVQGTERRVVAYRPRVLILDLNMPGELSLPAIPRLRET